MSTAIALIIAGAALLLGATPGTALVAAGTWLALIALVFDTGAHA